MPANLWAQFDSATVILIGMGRERFLFRATATLNPEQHEGLGFRSVLFLAENRSGSGRGHVEMGARTPPGKTPSPNRPARSIFPPQSATTKVTGHRELNKGRPEFRILRSGF